MKPDQSSCRGGSSTSLGLRRAERRAAIAGAFGGIFGWVLRTQQSLQRDLATGVKSLKGDHAMAGAAMLALRSASSMAWCMPLAQVTAR